MGKVLSDRGVGYDDEIIEGIEWAVLNDARVISMSLCSTRELEEPGSDIYEKIATRLIEANPGTLLIAAAGNASRRPDLPAPVGDPACCLSIVSVGAIDCYHAIAPFSARQMDHGAIDIVAPGVGIRSWALGSGHRHLSGTSMACPHAAGVAALIFAASPSATAEEVRQKLFASAMRLGDPEDFGAGLVQAPLGTE